MRRLLRQDLPALRAIYGLTWAEIASMPAEELRAHLDQLPRWVALQRGERGEA